MKVKQWNTNVVTKGIVNVIAKLDFMITIRSKLVIIFYVSLHYLSKLIIRVENPPAMGIQTRFEVINDLVLSNENKINK